MIYSGNTGCTLNGQTQGPCPQVTFSPANNNQLATLAGTSVSYDASGDMTSDTSHAYSWDAEGRLTAIDGGTTSTDIYNALGERAQIHVGTSMVYDYWYDADGEEVGSKYEEGPQWFADFYLGGRFITTYDGWTGATEYVHGGSLGSCRVTTGPSGSVTQDLQHYPWGQFWTGSASICGSSASMFGDGSVSNFYRTLNRAYGPTLGRWMTPDPLGGDITNPQSLNRYAYVTNNPETLTDPSGLGGPDFWKFCSADRFQNNGWCAFFSYFAWNNYIGSMSLLSGEFAQSEFVVCDAEGCYVVYKTNLRPILPTQLPDWPVAPQSPTPAQAATNYCQQHGQLSFNIPHTQIPVTISLSATAFFSFSSTNDIGITLLPSAGVSLDITAGAPSGPNIPVQVGVGKNASVGRFLTPNGPRGVSLSVPLSPPLGGPVTISPTVVNACGWKAGGG